MRIVQPEKMSRVNDYFPHRDNNQDRDVTFVMHTLMDGVP